MLERLHLIDGVKEVTLQSSTSSGSPGGGGSCPGADPSFTAAVVFAPLPPETAYSVKAVADTTGGAPAGGAVAGAEAPGRVK